MPKFWIVSAEDEMNPARQLEAFWQQLLTTLGSSQLPAPGKLA